MRGLSEHTALAHVDALMAWWSLAGVEACVDEAPADWLAPPKFGPPAQVLSSAMAASVHSLTPGSFPNSLDAFHGWLANSGDLPEAAWTGPRILPTGPRAPRLMVILDMPDMLEGDACGSYLSGDADTLLGGMLRALGLEREAVYIAALGIRRPPGGIIPAEARTALATRMKHHIALVGPSSALLLGDGTSRSLVSADGAGAPGNICFVNHAGGTLAGVSTFHPRLMLSQPSAKVECWRALQKLAGVWTE